MDNPKLSTVIASKLALSSDLARLSDPEKVEYYQHVCDSLGLNSATRPFDYLALGGRLRLYALRECTEQLRRLYKISISITSREMVAGTELYVVSASAVLPDGRRDESIGAVSLKGLSGENLSNAVMKCETKAKRRVTLSICGQSWLDESEVDSVAGAQRVTGPLPVATKVSGGSSGTPIALLAAAPPEYTTPPAPALPPEYITPPAPALPPEYITPPAPALPQLPVVLTSKGPKSGLDSPFAPPHLPPSKPPKAPRTPEVSGDLAWVNDTSGGSKVSERQRTRAINVAGKKYMTAGISAHGYVAIKKAAHEYDKTVGRTGAYTEVMVAVSGYNSTLDLTETEGEAVKDALFSQAAEFASATEV